MWGGLLGNGPHAEAHNCINSGCLSLRMDDCVLPPSFKIARATLVALMRPTLPVKVAELGVTLKPRCAEALHFLCHGACSPSVFISCWTQMQRKLHGTTARRWWIMMPCARRFPRSLKTGRPKSRPSLRGCRKPSELLSRLWTGACLMHVARRMAVFMSRLQV